MPVVGPALRRGSAMWALGIGPMHVRPRALLVRWVSQRLGTTVARGVLLYMAAISSRGLADDYLVRLAPCNSCV